VLLVATECGTCLQVVQGAQAAVRACGSHAREVVVVASTQKRVQDLRTFMSSTGIELPLYCDEEELFLRQYRVVVNPAFFRIDSTRRILRFGTLGPEYREYAEVICDP